MEITTSSHGDSRLTGEGGRRFVRWITYPALSLAGLLLVYPGGIFIGLNLWLPPESTAWSTYVWLGVVANLVFTLLLLLFQKRKHALALVAPALLLVGIELVRHL